MVKEKRTTTPYIDGSPHFGTEGDDLSRLIHLRHRMGKLEHLGEPKTFPKNHILIRSGTVPRSCYLVKSGQVVATSETSAGEELIFYIMETQALFGDCLLYTSRCV